MTVSKRDIDAVTGIETTGHEWDGIKELNKPLPRWWLLTFYATIVWAVGYWVVYPAWPTLNGYTRGMLGYSQRAAVSDEVKAAQASQGGLRDQLAAASLEQIKREPDLLRFAMAGGAAAFQANCAPCHGRGAQGFVGYPNLNDDDWLWGGKLTDINQTIRYGARSGDDKAHTGNMPAFGRDNILKAPEISAVADFVRSLSGLKTDAGANLALGKKVFADNCALCHGEQAKGNRELGAPDLTDKIWLYGSDKVTIMQGVQNGRGGVMPAWNGRLSEPTIKALTVYVHTFGGGEK